MNARDRNDNLIVITGPPGSGKTPVLDELRKRGFATVFEPAREVIAEQRSIDDQPIYDRDPRLFLDLMLSRAVSDFERARLGNDVVFFDRGIPDMIGYFELFGLDTPDASRAAAEHRYRQQVFVLPSWPEIYTTDEDRRMTFEQAAAFGDRVRNIYVDLGYSIVDVRPDTVAARATFILDELNLVAPEVAEWYHGSPIELAFLHVGSTITRDRDLARVFSHKPSLVSQDFEGDVRQIKHTGERPGFLYRIVDDVMDGDVRPHPTTTMDPGQEWLTNRELRVELIEPTVVRPDELLTSDERRGLAARAEAARKERQT